MKYFLSLRLTILLTLLVVASSSMASDDNQKFFETIKGLQTLQGQFKQVIIDDQGTALQDSSGDFAIERPGLFRWETKDPYTQLIVANKKILWLYDPELEQVTEKRFNETNSNTPIWLLTADFETLKNDYTIKKAPDTSTDTFELIPTDKKHYFKALTITFVDNNLSAMSIVDNIDQVTELTFTITSKNKKLPSGLFTFDIPEGVDVIYDNQ